jgi:hypothetical protein
MAFATEPALQSHLEITTNGMRDVAHVDSSHRLWHNIEAGLGRACLGKPIMRIEPSLPTENGSLSKRQSNERVGIHI